VGYVVDPNTDFADAISQSGSNPNPEYEVTLDVNKFSERQDQIAEFPSADEQSDHENTVKCKPLTPTSEWFTEIDAHSFLQNGAGRAAEQFERSEQCSTRWVIKPAQQCDSRQSPFSNEEQIGNIAPCVSSLIGIPYVRPVIPLPSIDPVKEPNSSEENLKLPLDHKTPIKPHHSELIHELSNLSICEFDSGSSEDFLDDNIQVPPSPEGPHRKGSITRRDSISYATPQSKRSQNQTRLDDQENDTRDQSSLVCLPKVFVTPTKGVSTRATPRRNASNRLLFSEVKRRGFFFESESEPDLSVLSC
jgi:hypothetical protein